MSKCDTMRPGDVLRLRNRETEEVITQTVRRVSGNEVTLGTDAAQVWIIEVLPVRRPEKA